MANSRASLRAEITAHLSTPLYRNAYLLTISSGGSAALGLLFWSLAARYYPPEVVGLHSALLSAMLLLAGIATFSFNNVLVRFIQPAGRRARGLIVLTYAMSIAASVPVSLIFLMVAALWLPSLFVDSSLMWTMAFTLSVAVWCIFVLQDYVLTGLRQAQWIPVENILFGVVKIGLLIVFARYLPQFGIFAAWNIPVLIALVPINYLIFRQLLPQHAAATAGQAEPIARREIVSFAAGNYLATLFGLAANYLLPILVASLAGTATNAYFFLPWMMVNGLEMWALNMTTSLTVEGALEPKRISAYLWRVVVQMLRLLLPAAAILFLAAPLVLRLFGPDYSANGTLLLRWLALSAVPNAIVVLGLSLARVENRPRMVVVIQVGLSGLGLGLSAILLPQMGLAGVGVAWFVSQSLVAALVAGTLLRPRLGTWRTKTHLAMPRQNSAEATAPESMRVSIIIDNYNYGRYLAAAIDSALAQTHPLTEVIVVDDGSTDGSREIIRSYGSRVRTVFKPNGGQASAFNAGFALCQGDIVMFLDSDDILHPEAAERMAQAFEAPGTVRAHCRMAMIDGEGRRTGGQKPAAHLPLLSGDLRREVLSFPDDLPWLPTSGNAFSAEVLRKISPIPEQPYRILADYYLSHVTPLFGQVAAVEAVSASYRVHGANNYARDGKPLDLSQLRSTIQYSGETHDHVFKFAEALGLPGRPHKAEDLLSLAWVGNRMISMRLEPDLHPIMSDSRARLLRLGWRAARRRFNASLPFKILFLTWLTAMAVTPRPMAYRLAGLFMELDMRRGLNRWLGRQRRVSAHPPEARAEPADA